MCACVHVCEWTRFANDMDIRYNEIVWWKWLFYIFCACSAHFFSSLPFVLLGLLRVIFIIHSTKTRTYYKITQIKAQFGALITAATIKKIPPINANSNNNNNNSEYNALQAHSSQLTSSSQFCCRCPAAIGAPIKLTSLIIILSTENMYNFHWLFASNSNYGM